MNHELLIKLKCALTHNLGVCEECKKCGKSAADIRIELIQELEKIFQEQK